MPLDPNIIMGFKPTVDLEDPNKMRADMQLNQLNQMKLQEAQQGMETKNAMRQLDPNSPTYGTDVMRLDPETGMKYGEYASKLESDKANTRLNRFKASREASGNLAFNPSDANVTAHIEDAILNKEITPEQATSSLEKVLGNPEKGIPPMSFAARKDYFLHLGLTADQQMKEITDTLDRDARAREGGLNRGVTLAGQASVARTAANKLAQEGGVGGGKPLTDTQSKYAGFALKADQANNVINNISNKGEIKPGIIKTAVEKIPFVGENLGGIVNVTPILKPSSKQQQIEQAERQFVNAVLRAESGAVINPSEFESNRQIYFPRAGDSAEVIANKAVARQTAIQAIKLGAGRGAQNTPVPSAPKASASGGLTPEEAAELAALKKKHRE